MKSGCGGDCVNIEMTADGERVAAAMYKIFLTKRESGASLGTAKTTSYAEIQNELYRMSTDDVHSATQEVSRKFGCRISVTGKITISDDFVAYVQHSFKRGIADILSFLSPFIH